VGSREQLATSKKTTSPQEILNFLDELFAYALSIGMTYEQYWYQDPKLINAYMKAEEMRLIRKNQELWLQGYYVYQAIGDLVPVLNPFSKEHKPRKYLDKPIPITRKEQEAVEQEKYEKMKSYMMSLVDKK